MEVNCITEQIVQRKDSLTASSRHRKSTFRYVEQPKTKENKTKQNSGSRKQKSSDEETKITRPMRDKNSAPRQQEPQKESPTKRREHTRSGEETTEAHRRGCMDAPAL